MQSSMYITHDKSSKLGLVSESQGQKIKTCSKPQPPEEENMKRAGKREESKRQTEKRERVN